MENVIDRSTEKCSVGVQLDFLIRSLSDIYDLSLNGTVPSRFGISVTANYERTNISLRRSPWVGRRLLCLGQVEIRRYPLHRHWLITLTSSLTDNVNGYALFKPHRCLSPLREKKAKAIFEYEYLNEETLLEYVPFHASLLFSRLMSFP